MSSGERRTAIATRRLAVVVALVLAAACGSGTVSDAGANAEAARQLALDSAHATLAALGVDPADADGAGRTSPCFDSLGNETEGRIGEYSTGAGLATGAVDDAAIDALESALGVEFLVDGRHESITGPDYRMVDFVDVRDGVDVLVTVRLDDAGDALVATTTPCIE